MFSFMNRYLLLAYVYVATVAAAWGTDPIYYNKGTVTSPPQIDATVFVNGGLFDLSSSYLSTYYSLYIGLFTDYPFQTDNTLYYTNLSAKLMRSTGGFLFQFATNGFYEPAAVVDNQGEISGFRLYLNATNVNSKGLLDAGSGLIKINGNNVNLARGGLNASTIGLGGGGVGYYGYYGYYGSQQIPLYLGLGTNNVFGGKGRNFNPAQFDLPNPQSPIHEVLVGNFTNRISIPGYASMGNTFAAYANTLLVDASNTVVQLILVATNAMDTNLFVRAGFSPIGGDEPGALGIVEWTIPDYDPVRGQPITNFVYLVDAFATQTNATYLTNFAGQYTQPDNYTVYVGSYPLYRYLTNNTVYTNTLLPADTVTNSVYAAYSISVGSTSTGYTPPLYPGFFYYDVNPALTDPTNNIGRIEINADRLDLTATRMRADGMVTITTSNLVSTAGATIDSPYVRMDLSAPNTLVVSNLVVDTVKRVSGSISVYSVLWTNSVMDATGTNSISTKYHIMLVDHTFQGSQQVGVYDLLTHAPNVVLADNLLVMKRLLVDADGLRIDKQISGPGLTDLNASILPRLNNFTNLGSVSVAEMVQLGSDREQPYSSVVNSGTISASGIEVATHSIENSGTLTASYGDVQIVTDVGKLDDGQISASGAIRLTAQDLKVRNCTLTANQIQVQVSSRLSDGGEGANSVWSCANGFALLTKPPTGDLLGTQIISTAPKFVRVSHTWAGENRGAIAAGYSNNAAIGHLVLNGNTSSLFAFNGAGANNALYVDYLDLQNTATNVAASLEIDAKMVVYFAAANLPVEQLDGQCGGRLRWVARYAGLNSSTNVLLRTGQTITVSQALRSSSVLDSDADGVVNALDVFPFDGPVFVGTQITNQPSKTVLLSWKAAAQTVYRVDYTTNLTAINWQFLLNYTNSATTNRMVTVKDGVSSGTTKRFYRVQYSP